MWVPSIAPMTFGNPLMALNPSHICSHCSFVGHLITTAASSISAFITRLVIRNAVLLPTLNLSEIDLNIIEIIYKNYLLLINTNQYKHYSNSVHIKQKLIHADIIDYIQQNFMLSIYFMLLYLKESGVASLHNANKHCLRAQIMGVPGTSLCNFGPITDSRYSNVSGTILNHAVIMQ